MKLPAIKLPKLKELGFAKKPLFGPPSIPTAKIKLLFGRIMNGIEKGLVETRDDVARGVKIYAWGAEKIGDAAKNAVRIPDMPAIPIPEIPDLAGAMKEKVLEPIRDAAKGAGKRIGEVGERTTRGIADTVRKTDTSVRLLYAVWFAKEPLRIFEVRVVYVTPSEAEVFWRTNYPADSKVNYGETLEYGNEEYAKEFVTQHRLKLAGLEPETTYVFEVLSQAHTMTYDAYYAFTTPKEE